MYRPANRQDDDSPILTGKNELPQIEVSGSSYEMGMGHGRKAKHLIEETLRLYRNRFATEAQLNWDTTLQLAARISTAVAAYAPDLHREMEGIADASGSALDEIVAINSRSEILALARRAPGSADECTSAVCLPEVTASGHTLLGRNWDQDLRISNNATVMAARPNEGPGFLVVTEAGVLMRDGLNDAGIGVTGNALRCELDGRDAIGMPVSVIRRQVLKQTSLAAACGEIFKAPRSISCNHLIGAVGGEAVDLETTPEHVFWVLPSGGLLTHANHFVSSRADHLISDWGPARSPSTLYRARRVTKLLMARQPNVGVGDLQAAFRDHFGWPDAVCNHPDPTKSGPPTGTIASIVMDLDDRRIWVAPFPVCQSAYKEYVVARGDVRATS